MNLAIFLVLLIFGSAVNAHTILILGMYPAYSHKQPMSALIEALVNKGHRLFVVNPNEVPPGIKKNYTLVDVSFARKLGAAADKHYSRWDFAKVLGADLAQKLSRQFTSETFLAFQRRVKEEQIEFDVIIGEAFLMPYTCGMGRYMAPGKPIVALSSFNLDVYTEESMGNLPHPSFLPYETPVTDRMSLWQRAVEESAREFFKESYGLEYASIVDGCWGNASLTMISSNSLYCYPRPVTPNIIELGPMHIRPPQELPQVLQDWLNGAEKGVIYFSLGSAVKWSSVPMDVRSNFLRLFKELPAGYRVLWKCDQEEKILGETDNILIQKWLPQQSVLAHPKVKLFITQGGFQSMQKAIHYGVPMVGIPHFGDQETNVVKMVAAGIGVKLMPQELHSYEKVKATIEEVLLDESYTANIRQLSAISRDFTPCAVDKAVFWVEHVAKHGGAHLRPATVDTSYFKLFCLDILSVFLVVALVVLYLIVFVFRFLTKALRPSSSFKLKES